MKNSEYWQKREAEALKHYITDEAEYDRQIRQIYKTMLDNCQKEIDSFYSRYAAKENITLAEAKKKVAKLDIEAYERKAKKYVAEKNFSKQANEEMRLYNATMKINRLELLKANLGLEIIAGHNELESFFEGILKGRTHDEMKRQAGILGKSILHNTRKADAIVNASFHNAKFSDRIWQYQDIMKADLSKLLQQGLISGKNPRALAPELRKYMIGKDGKGGAAYNAERLMRTELARVQTEAQKQSFERNGFEKYIFLVNGGCCHLCEAAAKKDSGHGKGVYLVKDMMPSVNAAPMHAHCRCSVAAYEDSDEYERWLEYLEKGGTTISWEQMKAKAQKGSAADLIWGEGSATDEAVIKEIEGLNDQLAKKYGIDMDIVGDELAEMQADWDMAVKWNAQEYMKDHPKVSQKRAESIVQKTQMPPRPTKNNISAMVAGKYYNDTTRIVEKDGVYSLKHIKKITVNQNASDFSLTMKEAEESMQRRFEKIEARKAKGRTSRLYVSNSTDGGAGTYLHEFGHAIDFNKGIAEHPKFKKWYDTLSQDDIETGLSSYAAENANEFIAEAFAESFFSYQRPMSKKFMSILDEILAEEKK